MKDRGWLCPCHGQPSYQTSPWLYGASKNEHARSSSARKVVGRCLHYTTDISGKSGLFWPKSKRNKRGHGHAVTRLRLLWETQTEMQHNASQS